MRRSILVLALLTSSVAAAGAAPTAVRAGGGCHDTAVVSTESVGTSVVKMEGCAYAPAISRVAVGTVVRFLNTADTVHDVTGRGWAWESPKLEPGEEWSATFRQAGVYPYSCSLHPGMAGMIVVGGPQTAAAVDTASPVVEGPETVPASAIEPATDAQGSFVPAALAAAAGLLIGGIAGGALARRGRSQP